MTRRQKTVSPLLGDGNGATIIFAPHDLVEHVEGEICEQHPEDVGWFPDFISGPTLVEEPEREEPWRKPVLLITGPLTPAEQATEEFRNARRVWIVEEQGNRAIARQVKNSDGPLTPEVVAAKIPSPRACLTERDYGRLETPLEHLTEDLEEAATMARGIWQGSHRVSRKHLQVVCEQLGTLLRAGEMWLGSVEEVVAKPHKPAQE